MNNIPNDYKSHLENIVSDLYKKFDEEDNKRKSLKIADDNYIKIEKKLSELIKQLEINRLPESIQVLENSQLKKCLNVSTKTLQHWRDNGNIGFSQIGTKIYYRISDIQEFLDRYYRKSTKI